MRAQSSRSESPDDQLTQCATQIQGKSSRLNLETFLQACAEVCPLCELHPVKLTVSIYHQGQEPDLYPHSLLLPFSHPPPTFPNHFDEISAVSRISFGFAWAELLAWCNSLPKVSMVPSVSKLIIC